MRGWSNFLALRRIFRQPLLIFLIAIFFPLWHGTSTLALAVSFSHDSLSPKGQDIRYAHDDGKDDDSWWHRNRREAETFLFSMQQSQLNDTASFFVTNPPTQRNSIWVGLWRILCLGSKGVSGPATPNSARPSIDTVSLDALTSTSGQPGRWDFVRRIFDKFRRPYESFMLTINRVLRRMNRLASKHRTQETSFTEDNVDSMAVNGTLKSIEQHKKREIQLYLRYSAASYCSRKNIESWSCGDRCVEPAYDDLLAWRFLNTNESLSVDKMQILESKFGNVSTLNEHSKQNLTQTFTHIHKVFRNGTSGTVGYILVNDYRKEIVVAFRGSASLPNFVYDLVFLQQNVTFPGFPTGVRVHTGFWKAYIPVRDIIHESLTNLLDKHPSYSTVFIGCSITNLNIYEYVLSTNAQIGHSLGGALATIAAVDSYTFLTNQTKIHSSSQFKVYSFGQPRIGNENFAKQVQILLDKGALNITRITAFDDLIPQIPPRFLGYVHHGAQEVWITATNFEQQRNEIYVCDILPEDPRCSNSLAVYSLPTHLLYWDVLFGPWC